MELDEDVEGMQSTIYFLQQQLRQTRDQLAAMQKENELLRNESTSLPAPSHTSNDANHTPIGETSLESESQFVQHNGIACPSVKQFYSSSSTDNKISDLGPNNLISFTATQRSTVLTHSPYLRIVFTCRIISLFLICRFFR